MIHSCATTVSVCHRIVLLHLCRYSITALERHNDRDIIDMERRWLFDRPYVDPMVEIVIELYKSFVDLSTFLLE